MSHLLSSRLSSRPLGWSKEEVTKMARLRVNIANEGFLDDEFRYTKF
ncbi:protein of unknown function [Petrocella atlantisensis]|uniref:Uncharacterized protein n=1 Tax=Petrocella atlantisensis TaxID=2173034 RepID=A0A3P7RXT2_9FIRM|nr:protein of unknown function [Petrocella atlantisensis]